MRLDSARWRAISAYVPAHIIQHLMADPDASLEGWQERLDAVVLFADVSGFTPLAERLARLGKEGAEDLTRILNGYFSTMIDVVHAYGGFVLRFGGDAITCQFPGGVGGFQQGVACASMMQRKMESFADLQTRAGSFTLKMKIGISGGPVAILSVGEEAYGLECVLLGVPVDRMAEAEAQAMPGEIVFDALCPCVQGDVSWSDLGIQLGERRGDFWTVNATTSPANSSWGEPASDVVLDHLIARLTPFIPGIVCEQIEAGHWAYVAEHRRVVSLFVAFEGLDYELDLDAGKKLQTYFVAMQTLIRHYGGRLNRVITGDKGSLLHIIFGAPLAHEDDELRAVRCAFAMRERLVRDCKLSFIIDQRIGIASGYVFAGNVGGPQRQEYTVMGDVVNLSSRLMQTASAGAILMDERTMRRIEGEFDVMALPPVQIKGKQSVVPVWRPLGQKHGQSVSWGGGGLDFLVRSSPMVGRLKELAQIETLVNLVCQGHGQLLDITGEAGVGKSRLFGEAFPRAIARGFESYGGTSPAYGIRTPYFPWVMLLRSFFGINDEKASEEMAVGLLSEHLEAVDPTFGDWVPIMAQFLGLPLPDTAMTSSLTPELRKQRLFDIVLTTLRHRARRAPLLLVFEDLHAADVISLEMLDYVARNIGDYRILLVALHRSALELKAWHAHTYYHRLALDDLPFEDAMALVRARLGMVDISPELQSLLLRGESQVNPFYLEEGLNALIDRGYLVPRESGFGYELVGDLVDVDVPDSIQSLVMSRIDRLDESSKLAVKVASVIGRTFRESLLHAIYPVPVAEAELHASLEHLRTVNLTLLDRPAPDWGYAFRHVITQEVAYESLLYAHRRDLHHRVAEYLEHMYASNLVEHYELLAYHYAESADREKGWHYLVKAGDKARARYANEAAIDFYEQALKLLPNASDVGYVQSALADVHQLLGRYDQAITYYRDALDIATSTDEAAVLRRKIAKTWAVQGLYDDALHYLHLVEETLDPERSAQELTRVYDDMGWIARQRGEYEAGLDYCLKGLTLIECAAGTEGASSLRGQLLHNLGSIYGRLGDYEKSIAYFTQCIEDSEARDDLYEAGRSYVNLAVVYWRQGDFDLVAKYLRRSLRIFGRIGYAHGTAMCHNNLGVLHYTQGQYPEAISAYTQSLQIRQEIGDQQGIADLHNNLGEVYQALSDYRQALYYLQRAARMFVDLGDRATLVDTYRLLAEVELSLEDIDEARTYAEKSYALAKASGNAEYQGAAARMLGQIYREAADLDASCRYMEESLHVLVAMESRLEVAQTHLEFGTTLLQVDRSAALDQLHKAAALFEELGLEAELSKALELAKPVSKDRT